MSLVDPADKYSSRPYASDLYSDFSEEGHPISPPGTSIRITDDEDARITSDGFFRILGP